MTVMLVSAVDPFPTDAGKKVVLAGFLEYLVDRHGAANVHYLLVGGRPSPNFPVNVHHIKGPSRLGAIASVALRAPTGRASLQEALLHSRAAAREIRRLRDEIAPTVEIYDTVRMSQFASGDSRNQICYLDDLFSERYTAMLAAARTYPDVDIRPLGNFATHVPPRLRPLADDRRGQIALLRAERALVRRSEDRAAAAFPRCLLVNPGEADVLTRRADVPAGRVQSIPPLVAEPVAEPRRVGSTPVFVFLGLLSLPHNDDGLRWFLTSVWPLVQATAPDARLRVIGRSARPELVELAEGFNGTVSVEGYVPDLSAALAEATALVNPLRFGSGIKLKVMEALARGVPVVSTAIGADGIRSGDDAGILVADEPARFAELMHALTDEQANARASAAATAHYDTTYSRNAVFAAYDSAFRLTP